MTTTDSTKTPAKGTAHAHGLTAVDRAIAGLDARLADIESRVAALEAVPAPGPAPTVDHVGSIPELLAAIRSDDQDEIVLAPGTYRVSPASAQKPDSLWITTARTRPVRVVGTGVKLDGGGATYFGGLTFVDGACHQEWDGFTFANGIPTQTGVIVFGGFPGRAAPHHIALRNTVLLGSLRTASTGSGDHGIYVAHGVGGPHDLLVDGLYVDGSGGLDSAVHAYHSDAANPNAWNVTIRNVHVKGTDQAFVLWDNTLHDWVIEDVTVENATGVAVRYESNATGIAFRRFTSTGSPGGRGWYSSKGTAPAGVTFDGCSFG